MKRLFIALALVLLFSCNKVDTPATGGGGQFPGETEHPDEVDKPRPEHKGRVVTSPDGRYLMYENGQPFFWLADTAWLLTTKFGASPPSFTAENPVVFSEHHHPKMLKTL